MFFIAIIFVPLQTSLEEYVFRGYLMQGIGGIIKNKWIPLLTTSLLFGFLVSILSKKGGKLLSR